MNKLILLGVVLGTALTLGSTAQAGDTAAQIPVTRDGKTTTRVSYQFWSGEYPGPIIDVGGKNSGTSTIKGFKSLRKLNQPVTCTIKNGLYHPWSTEKVSPRSFYSLTSLVSYKVVSDIDVNEATAEPSRIHLAQGSTIENVIYLSEGICSATAKAGSSSANVKSDIIVDCDLFDAKSFVKTSIDDSFNEEWLYLTCADGSKAFVGVKSLMKQKGVVAGELEDYGSVKRASKK